MGKNKSKTQNSSPGAFESDQQRILSGDPTKARIANKKKALCVAGDQQALISKKGLFTWEFDKTGEEIFSQVYPSLFFLSRLLLFSLSSSYVRILGLPALRTSSPTMHLTTTKASEDTKNSLRF